MDIDLALLADAATVDPTGKLNILGVFDRISAGSFPARHERMVLVLRFSAGMAEAGSHEVDIRLKGPEGEEMVRLDGEMQLSPGPGSAGGVIRVPHVLHLDGMVLPRAGVYAFDVRVDGQHIVSIPLTVADPGRGSARA